MKYIDEYRDGRVARGLASEIARVCTRPWVLMEICGGQTHTIMRYGLDELLPKGLELVHGPGCPVCVTPLETIDKAIELASRPDVTLVSYGDMLRVPGSKSDLLCAKAKGADVRVAYSPTEAIKIAQRLPDRKVVFLAIGFETTAPANAMAAWMAKRQGLPNFSMLVFPCAGPARDPRFAGFTRKPHTGIHRTWPCLHDHGMRGIRRVGTRLRGPHRRWRIRTRGPAASCAHGGDTTGSRAGQG